MIFHYQIVNNNSVRTEPVKADAGHPPKAFQAHNNNNQIEAKKLFIHIHVARKPFPLNNTLRSEFAQPRCPTNKHQDTDC